MAQVTYEVLKKPIEERIIDAACIYWNIERQELYKKSKETDVVLKKQIIYYLIKKNCPSKSLKSLAERFGFVSHMPVSFAIDTIEANQKIYKHISNDINQIMFIADKLDANFITQTIVLENKPISN